MGKLEIVSFGVDDRDVGEIFIFSEFAENGPNRIWNITGPSICTKSK